MSELIHPVSDLRDAEFRQAIYQGHVLRLAASDASLKAMEYAWQKILEVLGNSPRKAMQEIAGDDLFRRLGHLRRSLYLSDELRCLVADLLHEIGADPGQHLCDPARLRAVAPGGHRVAAAAPVYFAHRDTWYSNPQAQITWWLPLHDVGEEETFEFLPDYFDEPVENDSSSFDYDRWTSGGHDLKIGWQDPDAGLREQYPQLTEALSTARRVRFAAARGEVIVFSGQQLHQTVPIEQGGIRFSIDFRTVHLGDQQAGLGPQNVDNRSTGSALSGHVPLVARA